MFRSARIFLAAVLALPLVAAEQSATAEITAEIQRLEQALQEHSTTDRNAAGVMSSSQSALKGAREALEAALTYVALERLGQAHDLYRGARALVEKSEAMKGGMPAFEAEWAKANEDVASISRQVLSGKAWSTATAALRAIGETAAGRTVPLLDGSRGFATATGPRDGLFYLGEALGEAEFAKFCSSLALGRKSRAWSPRSLLPELLDLQAKADGAFQPPRSIEQHSRFIALNSTLKLARELDAARSYHGALYQYLEAVRHYAMLDLPPVQPARQPDLRTASDAERKKLASASRDDSILQVFLERGASQIAHPDGSAPTADEWRSAEAIIKHVVPAYAAAVKAPASVYAAKGNGKTIDITLVRWPYT